MDELLTWQNVSKNKKMQNVERTCNNSSTFISLLFGFQKYAIFFNNKIQTERNWASALFLLYDDKYLEYLFCTVWWDKKDFYVSR